MSQIVLDAASKKFGEKIKTLSEHGDEVIEVSKGDLLELVDFLRTDESTQFDAPVFVTCTDMLGFAEDPRFQVCYQLRSSTLRHRVRIKIGVTEEDPSLPSLAAIYPGFDWQERETYDMYGIKFEGHSDLRRIYMYDEFKGHPLRKDYPKDKRQPLARRDWVD